MMSNVFHCPKILSRNRKTSWDFTWHHLWERKRPSNQSSPRLCWQEDWIAWHTWHLGNVKVSPRNLILTQPFGTWFSLVLYSSLYSYVYKANLCQPFFPVTLPKHDSHHCATSSWGPMQSQWWHTKCWPKCNKVIHMGVSENRGTPKLSILIGISIINHPFWGTIIFGNTHMAMAATRVLVFPWHPGSWLQMVAKGNLAEPWSPLIHLWSPSIRLKISSQPAPAPTIVLKLLFVALSMRKDYLRAIFGKFQDCTIGCFHHQVQWRHQTSYGSVSNEIFVRLVIQCHFRARWSSWNSLRNIESHEICVRQLQIFFQTYTKIGQHHFSIDHIFDKTSHACNFLGKTGIRTKVCIHIDPNAKCKVLSGFWLMRFNQWARHLCCINFNRSRPSNHGLQIGLHFLDSSSGCQRCCKIPGVGLVAVVLVAAVL